MGSFQQGGLTRESNAKMSELPQMLEQIQVAIAPPHG